MAIASKPTCSLKIFALKYVNSQCQHDSFISKSAAKLHLFIETAKFLSNYFQNALVFIFFQKAPSGNSINHATWRPNGKTIMGLAFDDADVLQDAVEMLQQLQVNIENIFL